MSIGKLEKMVKCERMAVKVVSSFRDHFAELFNEAHLKLQISMPSHVESYLLDLLEFYTQPDNVLWDANFLASRWWLEAQNSNHLQEKIERLKILADHLLYMVGIFSEYFQRKLVDVNFYRNLSQASFEQLSMISPSELAKKTYGDLARNFADYVEVLNWVSLRSGLNSQNNTLHLYEQFLKTGSESAFQTLISQGIVLPPINVIKKAHQDE